MSAVSASVACAATAALSTVSGVGTAACTAVSAVSGVRAAACAADAAVSGVRATACASGAACSVIGITATAACAAVSGIGVSACTACATVFCAACAAGCSGIAAAAACAAVAFIRAAACAALSAADIAAVVIACSRSFGCVTAAAACAACARIIAEGFAALSAVSAYDIAAIDGYISIGADSCTTFTAVAWRSGHCICTVAAVTALDGSAADKGFDFSLDTAAAVAAMLRVILCMRAVTADDACAVSGINFDIDRACQRSWCCTSCLGSCCRNDSRCAVRIVCITVAAENLTVYDG